MSTKNICSSHRAAIEQAQSDFDVWLMHWELSSWRKIATSPATPEPGGFLPSSW